MSYGADYDNLFRRAAVYVDKILKGPSRQICRCSRHQVGVRYQLEGSEQIGITIPLGLLERANRFIK